MEIVAEWVTDERSAEMLCEWGIDYLQGFLYGKPELRNEFGHTEGEGSRPPGDDGRAQVIKACKV